MSGMGVLAAIIWQDSGALSSGNSRLLIIFVGLVALAMVTQAIVFVVLGVVAVKTQKKLLATIDEVKIKAMPIIQTVQDVARDTAPKVKVVTGNIVETSHMVREKAQQFEVTLADANLKTKVQVARVDSLMTTALNRTAALADTIHNGIRVPVKQAAGVVSGFRAGLDVLMKPGKGPNGHHHDL